MKRRSYFAYGYFAHEAILQMLASCEKSMDEEELNRFYESLRRQGYQGGEIFIGHVMFEMMRASPLKYQQALHKFCLVMGEDTQ